MTSKTVHNPLQVSKTLAVHIHATTRSMRKSYHAVNVWILIQDTRVVETVRHLFDHGGGTIDAGENPNVVARANSSIGAAEPLERGLLVGRHVVRVLGVDPKLVVAFERLKHAVLGMHMLTRRNDIGSKTNDLIKFSDRVAFRDGFDGHLMAGWYATDGGDASAMFLITDGKGIQCDADVVGWV